MRTWLWIARSTIIALHNQQLSEHGGQAGVRDEGLLDSALTRPLNKSHYGEPTVTELAAAYGYGLARNHPFFDGNKRTAMVATELFLRLNGCKLTASDADCYPIFLSLAEGALSEEQLADWLTANT